APDHHRRGAGRARAGRVRAARLLRLSLARAQGQRRAFRARPKAPAGDSGLSGGREAALVAEPAQLGVPPATAQRAPALPIRQRDLLASVAESAAAAARGRPASPRPVARLAAAPARTAARAKMAARGVGSRSALRASMVVRDASRAATTVRALRPRSHALPAEGGGVASGSRDVYVGADTGKTGAVDPGWFACRRLVQGW